MSDIDQEISDFMQQMDRKYRGKRSKKIQYPTRKNKFAGLPHSYNKDRGNSAGWDVAAAETSNKINAAARNYKAKNKAAWLILSVLFSVCTALCIGLAIYAQYFR